MNKCINSQNVNFIILSRKKNNRNEKKQENTSYNEKNISIKTNPEITQMIKLMGKYNKIVILLYTVYKRR